MNSNSGIALVTGANRGIGKEIARQLIEKGFFVIMTGRDLKKISSAQNEIDPSKLKSAIISLDVSSANEINNLPKKISEVADHLDVLVNNAGIIGTTKGISGMSTDEFQNVLQTNSIGPLFLIKALHPLLRKSNDPRVINISSGMGAISDLAGNYAAYRLSKVFLNMITILAANEFKRENM